MGLALLPLPTSASTGRCGLPDSSVDALFSLFVLVHKHLIRVCCEILNARSTHQRSLGVFVLQGLLALDSETSDDAAQLYACIGNLQTTVQSEWIGKSTIDMNRCGLVRSCPHHALRHDRLLQLGSETDRQLNFALKTLRNDVLINNRPGKIRSF